MSFISQQFYSGESAFSNMTVSISLTTKQTQRATATASLLSFLVSILRRSTIMCVTHDLIAASFEHAVAEYSSLKPQESEVAMISGCSLPYAFKRGPFRLLDKALERYHEYFKAHFDATAQIYPSLKETLAQLRKREFDLAILTGTNRKWAELTLSGSRLSSFFSVVMTSQSWSKRWMYDICW